MSHTHCKSYIHFIKVPLLRLEIDYWWKPKKFVSKVRGARHYAPDHRIYTFCNANLYFEITLMKARCKLCILVKHKRLFRFGDSFTITFQIKFVPKHLNRFQCSFHLITLFLIDYRKLVGFCFRL